MGETVGAAVVPEAATKLDELVAVMECLRAPGVAPGMPTRRTSRWCST
ncbi:hypothetical protein [Leifsonia xyli]